MNRGIFISFDHDHTARVDGFLGLRKIVDGFEFYNHKLGHRIKSADANYVARIICERWATQDCFAAGMGKTVMMMPRPSWVCDKWRMK